MFDEYMLAVAAFGVASTLVLMVMLILNGRNDQVQSRLEDVADSSARHGRERARAPVHSRSALPRVGEMMMPEDESKLKQLKSRLLQAGLYQKHATALYMGVKFVLLIAPMAVGLALSAVGMMGFVEGVMFGVVVGLLGTVLPALWLGNLKSQRQQSIRRALPDALDVIVVCVEGGLSLPAAMAKVSAELKFAHPLLANEMAIMRREVQLGRTSGEALKQFADRFDADELRSLASVVSQAEKFGASVVKALHVHADTLRTKRYQSAEAQAQRAPVKLIFPTVLCIFPALYIVLMAPAGVQILEMLENMAG